MKILITESKLHNTLEKYILEGYPEVKSVTFKKYKVHQFDSEGEPIIERNIIILGFISGQLMHSPTWNLRQVREDVNRMFGLRIGEDSLDWSIDWEITNE
jgi:hypothetical protein